MIKNRFQLVKYNVWILFRDENNEIVGFALYWTHPNKGHVPAVVFKQAVKILSLSRIKKSSKDDYHYKREISNIGIKDKMIVGKPIIKNR